MEDLDGHIRRIPELRNLPRAGLEIERLGGMTNLVYRVRYGGGPGGGAGSGRAAGDWVLRVAGAGTEAYIDRKVEAHNSREAAAAGVAPEVLFFDPADGLMLMPHVEATTMTPALFRATAGAPARAGRTFRQLHGSGRRFEFRFELFAMIDGYLKVLEPLGAELPDGYHAVVREAGAVRAVLDARPAELAPCHCDPLCENFLDTGERMWIVDWEYSGMNDPLWDLGDLSVEAGFDAAQEAEMMEAWCGGPVAPAVQGRMVVYKAMCDLVWTLWGLIQHANGNPAEDFWAYATGRFERCKALMGSREFADSLQAVKQG